MSERAGRPMTRIAGLCATALLLAGCGADEPACDPTGTFGCPPELACELVSGRGRPACVTPVVVRGKVLDSATGTAVVGARVLAVDESAAPLSPAVATIFDGSYEIRLHAMRGGDGRPLSSKLRLSASAGGYGAFPDAWREWPSIDLASAQATQQKDQLVVASASTDVALLPFAGGPGRGVLTGHVDLPPGPARQVVVVAEADQPIAGRPAGVAGWADRNGDYAIYGLAPGELRVRAYAKGASWGEQRLGLASAEQTTLDLGLAGTPAAAVSGTVEGGAPVQVALVVASTWDRESSAGEEPAGLRAALRADGGFTIPGVGAGRYLLVNRDADGWVPLDDAPAVEVAGADVAVGGRLRLVPALAVVAPGADRPQGVAQGPTLSWADHASEARYHVDVLNGAGLTMLDRDEPAHQGDAPSVLFGSPPLVRGQIYRFRAVALDAAGAMLSRTEDRRGVFYLLP